MSQELLIVIGLALLFGFLNGLRDSSNIVATMISSRAFRPQTALGITAVAEFFGPFLFGIVVAKTIGDQVVQSEILTLDSIAACLIGAILWNLITSFFGLPGSSSHALIGGMVGAVIMEAGIEAIKFAGLYKVLIALFTSPLVGFAFGFLVTRLIYFLVRNATPRFPITWVEGEARAIPEEQLPLRLPETNNFKPSGTGESPLANLTDWLATTDPATRKPARRETNTMPQWAGSCWYYLRFIDSKNPSQLADPEKERYWMPVDLYIGGSEHAVLHLLYARFWHKVLFDIGVVSTPEPFKKLVHQGIVLGEDNQKMSKSRGNVVNPDDMMDRFGADAVRLYEMFMGPLEARDGRRAHRLPGAAGARTARPQGESEAAVRSMIEQWAAAARAQDAATFASFYADDAVLMMEDAADVRGAAVLREAILGMMSDPAFALTFAADQIVASRSGDLAYETGSYSMTMTGPDGKPASETGHYIVVWRKQADGTWKVAVDAPLSDPPAA